MLTNSDPWTHSSMLTRFRLGPNPGPMTLEGTNSYVISSPAPDFASRGSDSAGGVVVVDPGPADEPHLRALADCGAVELVLITHHHRDHTAGRVRFHEMTGAPIRALDPAYCIAAAPLTPGERIFAAGVWIEVIATPGHTADSLCFALPDDGEHGSVLTGDTILGRGSTVICYPDGRLGSYLRSLETLQQLGPALVLPAHGPVRAGLDAVAREYLAHRHLRLAQLRSALLRLGPEASAREVAADVYSDVPGSVRAAAELSVAAQLDYLGRAGGDVPRPGGCEDGVK
ncbi:MBL fold metallo-hydrolase [Paeniglutamicibacter antarcticus]|uniref:MBL fold metallo-hydrolase n=1 Tax=Arthrobacter terrae TaxID=2935737 RepID=A0A931G360_9MICC|nr:MBL fold metallo-hydrolase [Arthrobacter terrae]MBG0738296.1 MBL fold metallo-hydrolase [Arthrobacter terrae]